MQEREPCRRNTKRSPAGRRQYRRQTRRASNKREVCVCGINQPINQSIGCVGTTALAAHPHTLGAALAALFADEAAAQGCQTRTMECLISRGNLNIHRERECVCVCESVERTMRRDSPFHHRSHPSLGAAQAAAAGGIASARSQ